MRNPLDASVLNVIDIQDQPASSFVFVLEGMLGTRQAFAVDGITAQGEIVSGWLGTEQSPFFVVTVHQRAPWAILSRKVLETYSMKASITRSTIGARSLQDHEVECVKEYFPERIPLEKPDEKKPPVYDKLGHYI